MFIANVDVLKFFFVFKRVSQRSWSSHFLPRFDFLSGKLWKIQRFSGCLSDRFKQPGVEHDGKRNTEPTALQASRQIQVGRNDVTLRGLAAEHLFQNGGCRCWILGFFGDWFPGIVCNFRRNLVAVLQFWATFSTVFRFLIVQRPPQVWSAPKVMNTEVWVFTVLL